MEVRRTKDKPGDLKTRARDMLATIPREDMEEMLAKGRWTCDSNWMMALVMGAGWDAANHANLEVGKAVGRAEMHRLKRLLGLKTPTGDDELMFQISLAMEAFITRDYWDYDFVRLGPGRYAGIVRKCYAYTKTSSIGVEEDYRCGCFGLRAGWYEAIGVSVRERLVKCLKYGDEQCEILAEDISYPDDRAGRRS